MAYTFARDFTFVFPKRARQPDGPPRLIDIETRIHLEIDLEGLARMLGERAFKNKSKTAGLADGKIRATAIPSE